MAFIFNNPATTTPLGSQSNPLPEDFTGGLGGGKLFPTIHAIRGLQGRRSDQYNNLQAINPQTGKLEHLYMAEVAKTPDEGSPSNNSYRYFFESDPLRPAGSQKVSTTQENTGTFFDNYVVPGAVMALTGAAAGGLAAGAGAGSAGAGATAGEGAGGAAAAGGADAGVSGLAGGGELGGLSDAELADILAGGTGDTSVLAGDGGVLGTVNGAIDSANSFLNTPLGKALQRFAPGLLGYFGSKKQSNTLQDISGQLQAERAPYLAASRKYLADPNAYFAGPGKAAVDATLRGLSVRGNPYGIPTSLELATEAGMRDWQNAVTGFGNLGLAGQDTRAQLLANAAGADANGLNSIGYGLGQVVNPTPTLAELLKQIKGLQGTSLA